MRVRCPVCRTEAEVDKDKRTFQLIIPLPVFCFPSHSDCPLAVSIDKLDMSKVDKVVNK